MTAGPVPRLKVKWAFGFPGDLDANAQPSVVGGRVFVGSQGGLVYSLSAESGCVHWFYKAAGAVRGGITVAPITTAGGQTYAAFFGDLTGNVHAVDAATGTVVWTAKADPHPVARMDAAALPEFKAVKFLVDSTESLSHARFVAPAADRAKFDQAVQEATGSVASGDASPEEAAQKMTDDLKRSAGDDRVVTQQ